MSSEKRENPTTSTDGIPPLQIRRARREDMPMVADFVRSSADWYRPICDEADMSEHDVDEAWADKNYRLREFHLGYEGDEAVGTISIQDFGDWAYLGYIYLDVAHVGKGYGRSLIRFAERTCRERGFRGLVLIAHPEAEWARKAYLKYGFEITATSKEDVLAWEDEALRDYYEEGFELYQYEFEKVDEEEAAA